MNTDRLFDIAVTSVVFAIAAGFLMSVVAFIYAMLTEAGC